MVRTFARLTAVAVLALPMALVSANPAAAVAVQTCGHVQGSATFTPGLTNTPTDNVVRARASETSCTPSSTTGGSGVLTATIKLPKGSCAGLASGGQTIYGTATSTWKNGTVTKFNLRATTGTGANTTLREHLRHDHVRPLLPGVTGSAHHHPGQVPRDIRELHRRQPDQERGNQQHQALGHSVTDAR